MIKNPGNVNIDKIKTIADHLEKRLYDDSIRSHFFYFGLRFYENYYSP